MQLTQVIRMGVRVGVMVVLVVISGRTAAGQEVWQYQQRVRRPKRRRTVRLPSQAPRKRLSVPNGIADIYRRIENDNP